MAFFFSFPETHQELKGIHAGEISQAPTAQQTLTGGLLLLKVWPGPRPIKAIAIELLTASAGARARKSATVSVQ